MALYCRVISGSIVEGPMLIPNVWRNISNPGSMPDSELRSIGWLPVNVSKPSFDHDTQLLTGPVRKVFTDRVDEVWTVAEREILELKKSQITALKRATSAAILAEAPEYAQRNAALGISTVDEQARIVDTIVMHRDACNAKEAAILAATNNAAVMAAMNA